MNFALSPQDKQFQLEVRDFIAAHLPEDVRRDHLCNSSIFMERDQARRWQTILAERGWAAPGWPVEHGGQNWTRTEHYLFAREYYLGGAPMLMPQGIGMLAPVLFAYGSDEQKARYLPAILSGEHYWCQGYSEPGAGSDLAALSLKAVRQNEKYVLNGSKIWTTHAQFATHCFCLARTSTEGRRQAGISFLLVDMSLPGITVEPIVTLAGDHEVNQVFFDNVEIAVEDLVGEQNKGWTYAKYLLEHERGSDFNSYRLYYEWQQLQKLLEAEPERDSINGNGNGEYAQELARLQIELKALEITELRLLSDENTSIPPAIASTILKLQTSRLDQRINALGIDIAGYETLISDTRPNQSPYRSTYMASLTPRYLNNRAQTIFGGSDEVLQNVLAKAALGL